MPAFFALVVSIPGFHSESKDRMHRGVDLWDYEPGLLLKK
jgi:hypothetical protein